MLFYFTLLLLFRLHDGGFTMPTDNGEPASPVWINWITYVGNVVITEDTNYSGILINNRLGELMIK